jgi:hypothetical protein
MLVMFLEDEELFFKKKESKKVPHSTVESYDKQALKDIYGDMANINLNRKGLYQVNILHTKENMNRLVEEELERQEEKIFKDWNSNSTRGILNPVEHLIEWDISKPIGKFTESTKKSTGIKESQNEEKAPIFTYCNQMKNAIEALSLRSLAGHKKYEEENDWENFSRVPNGDFEYSNAQFRHALSIGKESERDHRIAEAWNAVSRLEIYLRSNLDIKK